MPLRVVVTGTQGQVVRSLLEIGTAEGADVVAIGRPTLDLTDLRNAYGLIAAARPQVLVSAAAYTDTESAEIEPEITAAVNVRGAACMADCARKLHIPIIHLSTAYVFDGRQTAPFREDDPIAPLNTYGRTKAQGEAVVAATHPEHVILRTSLVYGPAGKNFLTAMLALAAQQPEIAVVNDQQVNPTLTYDFARGILVVARNLVNGGAAGQPYGIFHMAGATAATPAEFATAIFTASAATAGRSARVVPISSAQYVTRLQRPLNARLDCSKIARVHGVALPAWQLSLPTCFNRPPDRRA